MEQLINDLNEYIFEGRNTVTDDLTNIKVVN